MCGPFTTKMTWAELVALYRLTMPAPPHNLRPVYNMCPSDPVDVVVADNDDRELVTRRRLRQARRVAFALRSTCKVVAPGLRHGPAEDERYAVAEATVRRLREYGDPWRLSEDLPDVTGTRRETPDGAISMPAFGSAYSDTEIAAVANYVTARFGTDASRLTGKDIAKLRSETN